MVRMVGRGAARGETGVRHGQAAARTARRRLVEGLTFEVVPMASLDAAIDALPAGAEVSVTCSPTKGIEATQAVTADLIARGFSPVPHLSARLVRDAAHTAELAAWARELGLAKVFLVGGDSPEPLAYPGAVELLADFLECDHGLSAIGVTAYPDGHAFLAAATVRRALHDKQAMLTDAGVGGWCTTQMCFDTGAIATWLRYERESGLTLPVHLGVPGVVDRAKLLAMGARLGVGDSLRFLRKNRSAVVKMMTARSYDPDDLLVPLSGHLTELGIEGLHVFTFNQVAATEAWRQRALG